MTIGKLSLFIAALVFCLSACTKTSTSAEKQAQEAASKTQPGLKLKLEPVFEQVKTRAPIALLQSPGDDTDWYLVEKVGLVLRFSEDPSRRPTLFLDIRDRVDASANESGLLSMAFHPRYNTNHQVFLHYDREGKPLVSTISRFVSRDKGQTLDKQSEQVLLSVKQPYANHNGGQIGFGPDGYLYIGLGDGGSAGDPRGNAQNTKVLLGKVLRLDVDGGKPYAIPAGNPFADGRAGRPEIYAYGLRNPWRWSFDSKTGTMWLADVGQNDWEEIDIIEAGGNYGWNAKEGFHEYNANTRVHGTMIAPVAEYSHDEGCSVTGGYVYRGKAIPELQGVYIYGDFCSGRIWGLSQNKQGLYESKLLIDSHLMISSFAQGNDGEIYVLHFGGRIFKMVEG
jgi:glucose/arabinose dehydrogenase